MGSDGSSYDCKWEQFTYLGWHGEINAYGSYKVSFFNLDMYSWTYKLSSIRGACDVNLSYDIDLYQVYIGIIEFNYTGDISYVQCSKIKERYKICKVVNE